MLDWNVKNVNRPPYLVFRGSLRRGCGSSVSGHNTGKIDTKAHNAETYSRMFEAPVL